MLTQLNSLRDAIHANAIEKGFYDEAHHDTHYLALIIEEIGEAISADRKGQRANTEAYQAAINTHHRPIEEAYATFIKGSIEEELADIVIRLLDFAGYREADLTIDQGEIETLNDVPESILKQVLSYGNQPLSQIAIAIAYLLHKLINNDEEETKEYILTCIFYALILSDYYSFDLVYHIKEKMAYNATRPRLHGKKY